MEQLLCVLLAQEEKFPYLSLSHDTRVCLSGEEERECEEQGWQLKLEKL